MRNLRKIFIFFILGTTLSECFGDDIPFLPSNLSLYDPSVDILDYIKNKCAQRGETTVVQDLQAEARRSVTCIRKYVNSTIIQDDLRRALLANDVDGFFSKYCEFWPQVHACFQNTINLVKTCLNDTERQQVDESLEVLDSMQTFLCADNASEVTNFYRLGGVEMFQDNWVEIKRCVGSRGHKTIIFDSDRCDYVEWFRVCTNEGMMVANDSSPPADTMNKMFVKVEDHYCPSNGSIKFSGNIPIVGLVILSLFTSTMQSYLI